MENDYTITGLEEVFSVKEKEFEKSKKDYNYTFNLSRALYVMCAEISHLKKQINDHMENESIHYL